MTYQEQIAEDIADKYRAIRTKAAELAATLTNESEMQLIQRSMMIEEYLLGNILEVNSDIHGGYVTHFDMTTRYPITPKTQTNENG